MKNIVASLEKGIKPSLLLHSCCAPCSSAVIERLSDYFTLTVLYYNPNIEPQEEYEKRKKEQIEFLKSFKNGEVKFLDVEYDNSAFINMAKGLETEPEGGIRCHRCYLLRLEKTAQMAKKNGYEYFTTTLTVSPYKNAQVINQIGENLASEYEVKYLYSDFKKEDGYKRSIELSKKYNLYRQDYCGCNFSKRIGIEE